MLSPVSSSEPLSVRVVLGTPDTLFLLCFLLKVEDIHSLIINLLFTFSADL